MDKKINLDQWAKDIAQETGFVLNEKIYEGLYYSQDNVRSVIYEGTYQEKSAVLKVYNDERAGNEALSLEKFHKVNTSQKIKAPAIFDYKTISPHQGWMILEKLPEGNFLTSPSNKEYKQKFAELYLEYRKNFPEESASYIMLSEQLSPDEFHGFRISRWFELANNKETDRAIKGEKTVLDPKEFISRYNAVMKTIRQEFAKRKMIWCHGHFKPNEVYQTNDGQYYLVDFARTKKYPEGYELAFILWADYIMVADWNVDYSEWKKGIDEWLKVLKPLQDELNIKNFDDLMRASLLERTIGTILADITASDIPYEEKITRINLLYKFIDELL